MLIVVAIGGNALLEKNERPSFSGQLSKANKLSKQLAAISKNNRLVVTHGNGPQVGNALIGTEKNGKKYQLPLYACVAETQAEIGYMLEQSLQNELIRRKLRKKTIAMLTRTVVNRNDISFNNPVKPIGPFYSGSQAKVFRKKFVLKKDPRGGYRRVVASPTPIKIIESKIIGKLATKDSIVIALGGGGIPVYEKNGFYGIDAVIDKDLASACLATAIRADVLLILTDVDNVYLNYKKSGQEKIGTIKTEQLKKYMSHFSEGSMQPKIQACINFLENGGKKAIITSPKLAERALFGKAGTIISR